MLRTFVLGVLATVLALLVWIVTTWLELGAANGLLGVGAGLVLGLIREGSPLARYGAFLIGLVFGLIALVAGMVGWIGFAAAILILTVISAFTGGRLPLWAMILGAGVLAAMYEPYLMASAWFVLTQYPTAFFVALATSSGGFIVAVLVELMYDEGKDRDEKRTLATAAAGDSLPVSPAVPTDAIGGSR